MDVWLPSYIGEGKYETRHTHHDSGVFDVLSLGSGYTTYKEAFQLSICASSQ